MAANKSTTSIQVEIYGAVHQLRGVGDREHLERLAAIVDRKMREIGEQVKTVDSGKIAVLAALNLAEELHRCTMQQDGERVQIMEKVTELSSTLAHALDQP
ncbi:MAG: cell division protein ZapA [Acidobacteriota bacterium]